MVEVTIAFDCTQRGLVFDIATEIYRAMGYRVPDIDDRLYYFERSQHPQERAAWAAAESIYEMFMGDSPDYGDDLDEFDATGTP